MSCDVFQDHVQHDKFKAFVSGFILLISSDNVFHVNSGAFDEFIVFSFIFQSVLIENTVEL